ncbi:20887_t:CDS:2 [Rhizophagus irregularis]|nr:20887_t:CDS:2 [Rhizophagus irregularis]
MVVYCHLTFTLSIILWDDSDILTLVDGYKNVDDMIIASQSHAKDDRDFLEWIEFSHDVGRAWNRSHFNYVVAVKFFHNNKDFLKEKFNSWIEYSEAFEDMEWNITEPSIYHRKAVYTSRSW